MKIKIATWAAMLGFTLVLIGILSRFTDFITVNQRTGCYIIGLALMLLGTIWKVVLEMNEKE
ncbi:MAG: hypothetical protein JJ909_02865 [Roseivirga sp.]|uniref:hypothetical protein n=1 Tax=Roseivirga sp. TaxID=1964215 RepID=UPI001B22F738|nr:hypothetical protein [Roseivirga sp.]MBO6661789.1 hypothetical protein [Roseivirga sp.]MBO6759902.1 hypothetical protein [Roseivirga sp.]MBO6908226.1 hypothetical protein [Roseivirga sp.]